MTLQPALLVVDPVTLDHALAARALAALRATLTTSRQSAVGSRQSGHLAQKNTREHLGYCSWRTESPRCSAQRALIAALAAALDESAVGSGQSAVESKT